MALERALVIRLLARTPLQPATIYCMLISTCGLHARTLSLCILVTPLSAYCSDKSSYKQAHKVITVFLFVVFILLAVAVASYFGYKRWRVQQTNKLYARGGQLMIRIRPIQAVALAVSEVAVTVVTPHPVQFLSKARFPAHKNNC